MYRTLGTLNHLTTHWRHPCQCSRARNGYISRNAAAFHFKPHAVEQSRWSLYSSISVRRIVKIEVRERLEKNLFMLEIIKPWRFAYDSYNSMSPTKGEALNFWSMNVFWIKSYWVQYRKIYISHLSPSNLNHCRTEILKKSLY